MSVKKKCVSLSTNKLTKNFVIMKRTSLSIVFFLLAGLCWAQESIDTYVPVTDVQDPNSFAVVIANEHYEFEVPVPYALNDGAIFARYLEKTLGVPEKNIRYVPDASLNKMRRNLQWLSDMVSVADGQARAIVYYSGHGMPDEANHNAYLLPVDGYSTDTRSGVSTADFYKLLGEMKTRQTLVFLDACFSGAKREGGMMQAARGVAIRAKQAPVAAGSNMVVFSAATGDETAWPLKEKEHGLFTYCVLQQLNEHNGCVSLGELSDQVTAEVKRRSMLDNGKMQSPTVIAPEGADAWRSWLFTAEPAKRYENMPKVQTEAPKNTQPQADETPAGGKPRPKSFLKRR